MLKILLILIYFYFINFSEFFPIQKYHENIGQVLKRIELLIIPEVRQAIPGNQMRYGGLSNRSCRNSMVGEVTAICYLNGDTKTTV